MLAELGVGGAGVSARTGSDVGVDWGVWIVGVGVAAGWEHATTTKRSSSSRRTIRTQEQLSVALFALLQHTAQLLNLTVEFALSPGHVEGVSKERQPGDCIEGKEKGKVGLGSEPF